MPQKTESLMGNDYTPEELAALVREDDTRKGEDMKTWLARINAAREAIGADAYLTRETQVHQVRRWARMLTGDLSVTARRELIGGLNRALDACDDDARAYIAKQVAEMRGGRQSLTPTILRFASQGPALTQAAGARLERMAA